MSGPKLPNFPPQNIKNGQNFSQKCISNLSKYQSLKQESEDYNDSSPELDLNSSKIILSSRKAAKSCLKRTMDSSSESHQSPIKNRKASPSRSKSVVSKDASLSNLNSDLEIVNSKTTGKKKKVHKISKALRKMAKRIRKDNYSVIANFKRDTFPQIGRDFSNQRNQKFDGDRIGIATRKQDIADMDKVDDFTGLEGNNQPLVGSQLHLLSLLSQHKKIKKAKFLNMNKQVPKYNNLNLKKAKNLENLKKDESFVKTCSKIKKRDMSNSVGRAYIEEDLEEKPTNGDRIERHNLSVDLFQRFINKNVHVSGTFLKLYHGLHFSTGVSLPKPKPKQVKNFRGRGFQWQQAKRKHTGSVRSLSQKTGTSKDFFSL